MGPVDLDPGVISQSSPPEGSVVVGVCHKIMQVAPGSHGSLLIPEPLSRNFGHVLWIHMRDSPGRLGSGDQPVEVGDVLRVVERNL